MRNILFIVTLSPLLFGCGGGGSSTSQTPTPTPVVGVISGVAHDGPLSGAAITVHAMNGITASSENSASSNSDDSGNFQLSLNAQTGSYVLNALRGIYIEEASGVVVDTTNNNLRTFFEYTEGETTSIPITPATHWSSCYAEYLFENEDNDSPIIQANSAISELFGFDIIQTHPVDITLSRPLATLNNSVLSGYLFAAISSLTAEISRQNSLPVHAVLEVTSSEFIRLGCDDIKEDGLFDGQGANGQLSMLDTILDHTFYREKIAKHIILIANSDVNSLTFNGTDLINYADSLSNSNHLVWGGIPGGPVDTTPPIISTSFDESGVKTGLLSLNVNVADDLSGVSLVALTVNGDIIESLTSIQNDTADFQIDTSLYDDGFNDIKVYAIDHSGNYSEELSFTLQISNALPTITFTSKALTNDSNYIAVGNFSTTGAEVDRIEISGEQAVIADRTWSLNIDLGHDITELTAIIYDVAGNSSSAVLTVGRDLVGPQISDQGTITATSSSATSFNLCSFANFRSNISNPICLLSDKVSLNGQPVTQNLSNDNIWSVAIRYHDWEFDEVYTEIDDLVVEYKYERPDELVIDWTMATRLGAANNQAYVPITTEFLGDDFYLTDIDETHTIYFRVTDQAGNISEIAFNFRLNLIDPI